VDKTKKIKEKELRQELVSEKTFTELTQKIAEYLYSYTIRTKDHVSKERPKIIGGVSFWLEQKTIDDTPQIMLMYNVHPKNWNVNRVTYEFDLEEKEYLEYFLGVPFHVNH